jgi:uncharacterized membrane protein HdeD (DUF308 family)
MERRTTPPALDGGRLLAGVGALALLIGLFIDWYTVGAGAGASATAWAVFEVVDLLLAALAVTTLLGAIGAVAPRAGLPRVPDTALAVTAFIALALVTQALVDHPPAARDAELDAGIWISFAGALAMAIGALLHHSRVSLVITPRERGPESTATPPAPGAETETEVLRHR